MYIIPFAVIRSSPSIDKSHFCMNTKIHRLCDHKAGLMFNVCTYLHLKCFFLISNEL